MEVLAAVDADIEARLDALNPGKFPMNAKANKIIKEDHEDILKKVI